MWSTQTDTEIGAGIVAQCNPSAPAPYLYTEDVGSRVYCMEEQSVGLIILSPSG